MGGAMAGTLLRADYPVLAYDSDRSHLAAVVEDGARAADAAGQVVEECQFILTCLRTSEVWAEVAENELVPNARAEQVFLDTGITSPPEARRLAEQFAAAGAALVDCPVTGGPRAAADGSLRIFAGGDRAAVDRCQDILLTLGREERVVYCGPSGSGQVMKAVNQLAEGLANAAFVEAIAFGVRAGLDPAAILQAVDGEGWRSRLGRLAQAVVEDRGEDVEVNYPELACFLDEAEEKQFDMPMLEALYAYCGGGDHDYEDDMRRPRPSYWHELMTRGTLEWEKE
jgi:3-hydroxyisobutyrate dehydrogenase-like beta-hydroxyacid dehydrogenase